MAIVRKSAGNKCWRWCVTLLHYWWGCKLVQPLWRTVQRVLKKLKISYHDPTIPLLGTYLEETITQKDNAPQC